MAYSFVDKSLNTVVTEFTKQNIYKWMAKINNWKIEHILMP